MDEDQMNQLMMICCVVAACCAGLATVGLLIATAVNGLSLLIPALLSAGVTGATVFGATVFGSRVTGKTKVFSADIEKEVLNPKQRRELRRARGELVMEKALIDIEHERDNIVHKQLEAANDPDKPPHETTFSPKQQPVRPQPIERNRNRAGHDYSDSDRGREY